MATTIDTISTVAAHRRLINTNIEQRIIESAIDQAAGAIAAAFARTTT